jgi:hypothetical protein
MRTILKLFFFASIGSSRNLVRPPAGTARMGKAPGNAKEGAAPLVAILVDPNRKGPSLRPGEKLMIW